MIERTSGNQSKLNLALLNHVQQQASVNYQELFRLFGDNSDSLIKAHARFSKKMEYLTYTNQLQSTGRGHDRVFTLGAEAGKPKASAHLGAKPSSRKQQAAMPTSSPGMPLPYANLGRLLANALPTRSPVLRPGALDFKCVASRGFAC